MHSAAPVVWLRGDSGIAQRTNNADVSTWLSSVPFFAGDAVAPAPTNRPKLVVESTTTPSFVRFDGVDDGMALSQTIAVLQRPMTMFIVDRYAPTSTAATRQRNVQGTGRFVVADAVVVAAAAAAAAAVTLAVPRPGSGIMHFVLTVCGSCAGAVICGPQVHMGGWP